MVLCSVKQYSSNSFVLIGSFNWACERGALLIDLHGKGLTPRPSMADRGSS